MSGIIGAGSKSGVIGNRIFSNVDRWRLTANDDVGGIIVPWVRIFGNVTPSNLDANTMGVNIGAAMTESGGEFTFPSTGCWWILLHCELQGSSLTSRYNNGSITATDDDFSTDNEIAVGRTAIQNSGIGYVNVSVHCDVFYYVKDLANQKVKIMAGAENSSVDIRGVGSTLGDETTLTFIKVGD